MIDRTQDEWRELVARLRAFPRGKKGNRRGRRTLRNQMKLARI